MVAMQRQARWPGRVQVPASQRAGHSDVLLNRQGMQITRFGAARVARPTIIEAEHIGGDARVADIEAGSLSVTASQEGTAPDRRFRALDSCAAQAGSRTQSQFWSAARCRRPAAAASCV
jgi:hypothetical protein